MVQVSLMLTDDPPQDEDTLGPEVRPRFQSEWESELEGPSAAETEAAAAAAAPKRGRGRPAASRGGKWQVPVFSEHAL